MSKPSSAPITHIDSGRNPGDTSGSAPRGGAEIGSAGLALESSAGQFDASPKPPAPSLDEGDRLFTAGRYDEAGRCYAALAREKRLPAHRNVHWAYCRMVDVARRINLRPRTNREWDEIASEIGTIQRLTPNIWYGEYLRGKVAEVRRSGRSPVAKSDNLVVRASEPDEGQKQPETQARRFPPSLR